MAHPPTYESEAQVVTAALREAAKLLVREARRPGGPRGRGATAPVDAEMGELLCRRIGAAFPRDTLVSEENPRSPGRSGRVFCIDPHAGTRAFLKGHRETSISVALVDESRLALGVVLAPFGTPWTGGDDLFGPNGEPVAWTAGEPAKQEPSPRAYYGTRSRELAADLAWRTAVLLRA